jgi:predicted site-specific integrase-resolvase
MNVKDNQVLTIQRVSKLYGIDSSTLRRWSDEGHIRSWRSPKNTRMYNSTDLNCMFKMSDQTQEKQQKPIRRRIIYCRVSSNGQKNDLQRQIEYLQHQYPSYELITDIGSGINYKRKGLQTILEYCNRKEIEELVVAHKDRLCRFGFELIQSIIELQNGAITILDGHEDHKSTEQELADDLLSIIHVFNCRQLGKRRYKKNYQKPQSENLSNEGTETANQ